MESKLKLALKSNELRVQIVLSLKIKIVMKFCIAWLSIQFDYIILWVLRNYKQNLLFRGENGPGGMIIREIPGEPNKCEYFWLLNTDIKVL